jgi:YbbR domain-containing protein
MSLRRLIQENFGLKLFSLVLAVLIWFFIKYEGDVAFGRTPFTNFVSEDYSRIPIFVLTQPGDARVFKISPEMVDITVTAESAVLRRFYRRDFKVYLDLTNIRDGEPPSQELRVHVPPGVTVLNVLPRAVTVEQVSP